MCFVYIVADFAKERVDIFFLPDHGTDIFVARGFIVDRSVGYCFQLFRVERGG